MAYTVTVFSPMKNAERISKSLGIYAGQASISAYTNAAGLVEVTAISRYFVPTSNATTGGFKDGICSVQIDGPSSGGFIIRWDMTTGCFRVFYPTAATQPTLTLVSSAAMSSAGLALLYKSTATVGFVIGGTAAGGAMNLDALVSAPGIEMGAGATAVGTFSFLAIGFVHA